MTSLSPTPAPQILCLACSASLPPIRKQGNSTLYTTPCCNRVICPNCISRHPRLARYNPCLACGNGITSPTSATILSADGAKPNFDGAVRDEDTFVLGDSDDEEDNDEERPAQQAPPAEPESINSTPVLDSVSSVVEEEVVEPIVSPRKHYISRTDTLQGLSLRFGIPGRVLCKINNLPPSTLTTTPHILHTRSFILLSPAKGVDNNTNAETDDDDKERQAKRDMERAAKRLQTLTKETDWRIANAYVALASDSESPSNGKAEKSKSGTSSGVENRAIDQYLDDDAWEQQERNEGRSSELSRFPYGNFRKESETSEKGGGWFGWMKSGLN